MQCQKCSKKLNKNNKTGLCEKHKYLSSSARSAHAKYRSNHREEACERAKKWKEDNAERYLASQRDYHRTEPYVYLISNKQNKRVYFGSSARIDRWNVHKQNAFNPKYKAYDCPLYQAIRLVCESPADVDNHFEFNTIRILEDREEAYAMEHSLITEAIKSGSQLYNSPEATR